MPPAKQFTTFSNIRYILARILEFKPVVLSVMAVNIISSAINQVTPVFLPKLIIQEITVGKDLRNLFVLAAIFGLLMAVSGSVKSASGINLSAYFESLRLYVNMKAGEKYMRLSYESLEKPELMDAFERGTWAFNDYRTGVFGMISRVCQLSHNVISALLTSYVLLILNPLYVLVTMGLIVLNSAANTKIRRDEININRLLSRNARRRAGEKLSIVGENGAGKTTLVKLLTRLYDPDKGEILVDGVNIRELSRRSLNSLFSVVFQDYRMLPLTISEAVTISSDHDGDRLKSALERAGFWSTLESLPMGLNTILGKSLDEEGVELSGGQLQRLAIARALYKDANIAILDEPTAALDPQMELEVYERFNNLIGNKTTIFISHRLASCRFCDRIAVFSKGEIVELGSHDELLDRGGLYARMWEAQAGYYRTDTGKSVEDHG